MVKLGKKEIRENKDRKSRPSLVKLAETHIKWQIIKNAKRLKPK